MARCIMVSLSSDNDNSKALERTYEEITEYGLLNHSFEVKVCLDNTPVFHITYDHLDFDDSIFTSLIEDGCPVNDAKEAAESQYDVAVCNLMNDTWKDRGYLDTQLHAIDLHIPFQEAIEELGKIREADNREEI